MAIFIDTLPYMKALPKVTALPPGHPMRKGELVFLMANDYKTCVNMTNNSTVMALNKYHYYYYKTIYSGRLYNKMYRIRDIEMRKNVMKYVDEKTNLIPAPLTLPLDRNQYSLFYDMSRHMTIFWKYTETMPVLKKILSFWEYINDIYSSQEVSHYNKHILIDANNFVFKKGSIKELSTNPLFIIYYSLYRYYNIVNKYDMEFIIYCNKMVMRFNPSLCDKNSKTLFKRELNKLMSKANHIDIENELDDTTLDKQADAEMIAQSVSQKYNFVGDKEPDNAVRTTINPTPKQKITRAEDDSVSKVSEPTEPVSGEITEPSSTDVNKHNEPVAKNKEVENDDKEMIEKLYNQVKQGKTEPPKSAASSARDEVLKKEQKNIVVKGMTIEQLDKIDGTQEEIPSYDVSKQLKSSNKNMYKVKFNNFEKMYNQTLRNKDIIGVFESLNTKQLPMYIIKTEVEDSSNELNYKETWKITMEDEKRQRHNITVDIPKFYEDKFLYLGGNKKNIVKQNFMYPVVKTAPDTVQIVTNYNKLFIRRIGSKSLSTVEKLIKICASNEEISKFFGMGNASNLNADRVSTLEYDELSKTFYSFKHPKCQIYFNRADSDKFVNKSDDEKSDTFCIGLYDNKPLYVSTKTGLTQYGKSIIDTILDVLGEEFEQMYRYAKIGKRLLFNTATIMAQTIPLVTLLCYWEGLSSVLKKANIKFRFIDKRAMSSSIEETEDVIKFSDCYLLFENSTSAQLLLNGLNVINTASYSFEDMDTVEPYVEYFKHVYGKAAIINTLTNAYEFLIDNITLEILKDINLPQDIVSLCIYASNLLTDNKYTREGNDNLYRVRSNEIIPAILYATVANQYINYRNSGGKTKLTIPRDSVIKQLLALQTVEDYSTLNPVVEISKFSTISCKGWRGANVDQAYTEDKRSYDPSMVGKMAMNTSPDGNCGVNRELTMEPLISNARGFSEKRDIKDMKDVNLFSLSELVTVSSITKDDTIRSAMAVKQTKHCVPLRNSYPTLISNGVDEAMRFRLSSDFVVNADEDGEIIDYNEKTNMMIAKYKSGRTRAIDLSPKIVKNGAGGFYLSNQLKSDYKVGDKFKKNDLLAYHKDFFTSSKISGTRFNVGPLAKVAVMSTYNTYQDGGMCTEKLSKQMGADLVFCQSVVIGMNSNIEYMAKIGDHVEIGDSLVQFDTSFNESELNKFLASLSDELKEEVNKNSRNNIKATHSGVIEDIKMYSTIDLEDMSPTLRDVVGKYYKRIKDRKSMLEKYDTDKDGVVKCGILFTETTDKVEGNAYNIIKGNKVEDGVLVEFYIKHLDLLGVGDKTVLFTANKTVVSEYIPKGYEPYSADRPEEEVSVLMGESAILKRMTSSVLNVVAANKVIVELKRKLKEIYDS